MSDTPETDEIEKHDGFTIRDSVTTCGDESSSVYINVIHARELERERNKLIEENKKLNKEVDDLIRQRPLLIEDFKRERDEARDAILGWENKWRCAVDMAARAELERDDAWEDAKLLSERLTALELQSTAELARLEKELANMTELIR
jgi:hypothetical protein